MIQIFRHLGSFRAVWFFAALLGLFAGAHGATVQAEASTSTATVGEDIIYTLTIREGSPDVQPPIPNVEGLEIDFMEQTAFSSNLAAAKHVSIYRYRITPMRAGEFVIPPYDVTVDGERLTVREMPLKAVLPRASVPGDFQFGEIIVPRRHAYVGEVMEIDLAYYIKPPKETQIRLDAGAAPSLGGDGFSLGGRDNPSGQNVQIAGESYRRVIFRTAITLNRAGKVTVGPAIWRTSYSEERPARYGTGFSFSVTSSKAITFVAPAVELDVRPLPAAGRPKDFSGAIGTFRLETKSQAKSVDIGQPLGMALQVSGRGNFDRIGAPVLASPDGWRSYPPKDSFEAGDRRNISGVKSFHVVVVPEKKHTTLPVFEFSYFDPDQAKYITHTSEALPLTVTGDVAPAPAVPPPAPGAPAKPPAPVADIVGLRPLPGFWGHVWAPAPALWYGLILAPAPVLAALLYWRARRSDPQAARRAALLREKSALLARLRSTRDRAELFDAAAHVMQLEVALATGQPVGAVDEATVLARSRDAAAVKRVFAARAELVYAGGETAPASTADRDEAIEAVELLAKAVR